MIALNVGYLLYGHVLVCKVVPREKWHPTLWIGCNRKMKVVPTRKIETQRHNRVSAAHLATCFAQLTFLISLLLSQPKKPAQYENNVKRLLRTERAKRAKLKELGIDYDFPGYVIFPHTPCPGFVTDHSIQQFQHKQKAVHTKFE